MKQRSNNTSHVTRSKEEADQVLTLSV